MKAIYAPWSKEQIPPQERGPTPAGKHCHSCPCGRFWYCSRPLDQCDEPDECPWCVEQRDLMTRPAKPPLFPIAKPKKPRRRPPYRRNLPPVWTGGRKRRE